MTAVETIALILVVVGLIKLVVLMINPSAWFGLAKGLTRNTAAFRLVALVLGAVILRYLLTELTIVQIFASSAFMATLMWIGFAPYKKELMEMMARNYGENALRKNWLLTIIWLAISLWVLKDIFA